MSDRPWVPPGSEGPPPSPSPPAQPAQPAPPAIWPPPPGTTVPPGAGPPGLVRGPTAGDARTGPLPLHPMTLGDILDGAFKLLKANARTVFLVTALFTVPVNLLVAFLGRDVEVDTAAVFSGDVDATSTAVQDDSAYWAATLISLLAASVVLPFVSGAVSRAVASSYLGQQLGPGPALRATGRRFFALVFGWVLVHLLEWMWVVLAGVLAVVGVAIGGGGGAAVVVVAVVAAIVLFVRQMALLVAVAPAIVVEELGPFRGVRRSSRLLRPRKWRVLGVAVVSGILASIVGSAVAFAPQFVGGLIGQERGGWLLVALGGSLSQMLTLSIVAIVATLVYFDGRIRQEGFDLQVMAADLARGRPR